MEEDVKKKKKIAREEKQLHVKWHLNSSWEHLQIEQKQTFEGEEAEEEFATRKGLDLKKLRGISNKFEDAINCTKEVDPNSSWSGTTASPMHSVLWCYTELLRERIGTQNI